MIRVNFPIFFSIVTLTFAAPASAGDFNEYLAAEADQAALLEENGVYYLGNWCEWLKSKPGRLYRNKENPWIDRFTIGGRINYQYAHVDGNDVQGRDFSDNYDELRRLRLETRTDFLRYFTADIGLSLVDDTRYLDGNTGSLGLGQLDFDEFSLQFDIGEAFGAGPLDAIKVKAGRMRLRGTEEGHTSSKEILTIERSTLEAIFGGQASRPTGVLLELDKGDWELQLGIFSAEDDPNFISEWQQGSFYYGSLHWNATDDLKFIADYIHNDSRDDDFPNVLSDALGYDWAGAFSTVYERNRWGIVLQGLYGSNSEGVFNPLPRRQGDYYGGLVMPWVWIVEDRLQFVLQYQYLKSEESQGLQIRRRYIRADHSDPAVDDDNGRGNEHHSAYAGLNYLLCGNRAKVMAGVSYDELTTRNSSLDAFTYSLAFRTYF